MDFIRTGTEGADGNVMTRDPEKSTIPESSFFLSGHIPFFRAQKRKILRYYCKMSPIYLDSLLPGQWHCLDAVNQTK